MNLDTCVAKTAGKKILTICVWMQQMQQQLDTTLMYLYEIEYFGLLQQRDLLYIQTLWLENLGVAAAINKFEEPISVLTPHSALVPKGGN